jgi:hypothetical protein
MIETLGFRVSHCSPGMRGLGKERLKEGDILHPSFFGPHRVYLD